MKNYSQNNEQDIILNYLHSNNLHSGVFLDLGANDGESFSNTRGIMLTFPHWKGIFIEASSHSFSRLFLLYQEEPERAELINSVVLKENLITPNNLIEFFDSPTHNPASSIDRGLVNRFISKVNGNGVSIDPRKVLIGSVGLKTIMNNYSDISFDFINVDIEGGSAEMVLQDWFNPRNYGCKILCIEHDGYVNQLTNKFNSLGYTTIDSNGENLIFGL
jgi:hypothetical protein